MKKNAPPSPVQVRIYFPADDAENLRQTGETLETSAQDLIVRIVRAGLLAIKANGNRMPLPLRFSISNEEIR